MSALSRISVMLKPGFEWQNLAKRGHGPVPAEAEEWSPATLHERLVKTGARIVFAEISVGLTCSGPLPSA
jgi:hypothetical protein